MMATNGHWFIQCGLIACILLTVNAKNANAYNRRFEYILRSAGDRLKRNNVSTSAETRPVINHVHQSNSQRIQTLYQLLEHRPEPQTCYTDRSSDRTYRFHCPTPSSDDLENGWQCITIDDLCNNIPDCPGAEDEDLVQCMFYMAIQHQTQTLRQIIVRHYEQMHAMPNTVNT